VIWKGDKGNYQDPDTLGEGDLSDTAVAIGVRLEEVSPSKSNREVLKLLMLSCVRGAGESQS
jgi:hypothetical protein